MREVYLLLYINDFEGRWRDFFGVYFREPGVESKQDILNNFSVFGIG